MSDKVVTNIRIKQEMRDWLADRARQQDRSINWTVNKILEKAMEQDRPQESAAS